MEETNSFILFGGSFQLYLLHPYRVSKVRRLILRGYITERLILPRNFGRGSILVGYNLPRYAEHDVVGQSD